jgi:hypothetical protein
VAGTRYKPEEIVAKLRQVDVLVSQGQSVVDAVWSIGVTDVTYYRWRSEFGGLKTDQVKRITRRAAYQIALAMSPDGSIDRALGFALRAAKANQAQIQDAPASLPLRAAPAMSQRLNKIAEH